MRRRIKTSNMELAIEAAKEDCRHLAGLIAQEAARQLAHGGDPLGLLLPDPEAGPEFTRRSQAKRDMRFWREHRKEMSETLGLLHLLGADVKDVDLYDAEIVDIPPEP